MAPNELNPNKNGVQQLLPDKATILHNKNCAYCGEELTDPKRSKEHVIGRRFVPKGQLNRQWNLIINACKLCNGRKSDLENDISAITIHPSVLGKHVHNDPVLNAESVRRSKQAFSRKTKKLVSHSYETLSMKFPIGQLGTISCNFTAPPQVEETRIFELAHMHTQGFFYWITYKSISRIGHSWPGNFMPFSHAFRPDWGNTLLVDFAAKVRNWDTRVIATAANGYFKVALRKANDADCWSWAFEWNKSLRAIGFLGDIQHAEKVVSTIRPLDKTVFSNKKNEHLAFRSEVPLLENEDCMFDFDD